MAASMAGNNSNAHQAAFAASQAERDRTLAAIHDLESAVAKATRPEGWLENVARDISILEATLTEEERHSLEPDSLLSLIETENPRRFGGRVRRLHEQRTDIIRQLDSLRAQFETGHDEDPGDLRHRVAWLVQALHHYRAVETDLVYEAIERDLGAT